MDIPESINKGGHYEVKIENVYDPSKFWIIVKFKELNIFMNYLKSFYDNVDNRKTISTGDLKKGMMCIVCKAGMYYRCNILPVVLPNINLIRVFVTDFGYIVNVSINDLFHIHEKHENVPRFAIRASLSYLAPTDHSKTWTQTDLKVFRDILGNRRIFVKIYEIDTKRNILFVDIYVSNFEFSASDILVNLKLAMYNKYYKIGGTEPTKYKSTTKYPYLFPSFEALEGGAVPSSLCEKDLLAHCVPLDLLYKSYYQYQDIPAFL